MTATPKSDTELAENPDAAASQQPINLTFNSQENYNVLVANEGLQNLQAINYLPKEHQRKAMAMAEKDQEARLSRMNKELEATIALDRLKIQNTHELNLKQLDATAKADTRVQVFSIFVLIILIGVFSTAVVLWLVRDNNAAWYLCGGGAVISALTIIFKSRMKRKP